MFSGRCSVLERHVALFGSRICRGRHVSLFFFGRPKKKRYWISRKLNSQNRPAGCWPEVGRRRISKGKWQVPKGKTWCRRHSAWGKVGKWCAAGAPQGGNGQKLCAAGAPKRGKRKTGPKGPFFAHKHVFCMVFIGFPFVFLCFRGKRARRARFSKKNMFFFAWFL